VSLVFQILLYAPASFGLYVLSDASRPWQFGLQDPASPVAVGIMHFHHDLMFVLIFIVIFVGFMLWRTLVHFASDVNPVPDHVVHGTAIEFVWSLLPALILMIIAIPSFGLLYCVDESLDPLVTVKITGHQWYWSYEYSDYVFITYDLEPLDPSLASNESCFGNLAFDSYLAPVTSLFPGQFRLLEVDNRIVLPLSTHVRFIITSGDVLHCWTVPAVCVKIDACPGRLNQAATFITRQGVFYGQCSEICGINHGFMPIAVEVLPLQHYASWVTIKMVSSK
jgi:cytochrome c oxidase subunit 2